METLKNILLSSKAQAFYWLTFNGFLGIIIVGVTELDWIYAPILIALLNGITKYINVEIIQKKYS